MNGIAVIPARGGSKRLKNKNIIKLNGKPLIHYALDAVSSCFDPEEIMVASDSEVVLNVAKQHQCLPRLEMLPPDTTTDRSTVLDSICWMFDKRRLTVHGKTPDYIGMFLPTCPLRTSDDVINGINEMTKDYGTVDRVEGVISTTDYEFPPTLGLVKDQDGLLHCSDASLPWLTGNTRSQDHTGVIRPNGAMYLKTWRAFDRDRNFYKGRIRNYHMPRNRSADIDTIEDLKMIEALWT
jgi:CMP-N-acetylneuraminic acid synthetase